MIDPRSAALIIIDMQNGFIDRNSSLCIAGAEATVSACAKALEHARELDIPVFHICREYAPDGSNVESTRFGTWLAGGRPLSTACSDKGTLDFPDPLKPKEGEPVIVKPRFSAFFGTNLDQTLREQSIGTVILTGTTTPNCIRSTCYDALSLDYNVAIIEDCTSSRSPEVQAANIEDMTFIGAQMIDLETFLTEGVSSIRDIVAEHHARIGAI